MAEASLEMLQLMVQRVLDSQIAIREDVRELKHRMSTVEQQISNLAASEASHYASLSTRLDRLETRVERIERRLDLVESVA
jgi:hypothetical protein